MKDLFDPTLVEQTRQRILQLRPESERQWGSMTVAQTLAHCTAGVEMAMGIIKPKRASFPANVLGPLIKPLVLRDDKPMRRNSPSYSNSSPRNRPRATSSRNATNSSQPSTTSPRKAPRAARLTRIHFVRTARWSRSSGPS